MITWIEAKKETQGIVGGGPIVTGSPKHHKKTSSEHHEGQKGPQTGTGTVLHVVIHRTMFCIYNKRRYLRCTTFQSRTEYTKN
jgi:hypothetical protein